MLMLMMVVVMVVVVVMMMMVVLLLMVMVVVMMMMMMMMMMLLLLLLLLIMMMAAVLLLLLLMLMVLLIVADVAVALQLRVSCVEEPPCPSLSYAEPCSGHGQCSAGRCVCDMNENEAWGDVACDVKVEPLQNGIAVPGSQIQGTWNYYTFLVPERSNMLLVDMDRIRGDPVLFVKHQDSGFARDGLPAVLDYDLYADQVRMRLSVLPGEPLPLGPCSPRIRGVSSFTAAAIERCKESEA